MGDWASDFKLRDMRNPETLVAVGMYPIQRGGRKINAGVGQMRVGYLDLGGILGNLNSALRGAA